MNHCGEKFHGEVAKFRFLNELIKVLSPKVGVLGLTARPSARLCSRQARWCSGPAAVLGSWGWRAGPCTRSRLTPDHCPRWAASPSTR